MTHNSRIGVAVLLVFVAGLSYWGFQTHVPAAPAETIRIGAVLSLTGDAAADSLNIKRGIELAKSDLAKQGIAVDITYQDDQTDPKQTVSALQYLLATSHPEAIIGPTWSFLESAAAPTIASAKIVAYAPADTSEFVSIKSPYQFQGAPRNALVEQPIAEWLKANGKKRVAIIVSRDGWGESLATPFRAAAKDAGAAVVVDESIQTFSADAGASMADILVKVKAAKADTILYTGYDQDATALVKKRLELNLNASLIAATTVYSSLMSRNVVSAAQLGDAYLVAVPTSPAFIEKFTGVYGEAPGNYADRAYDGLMILAEAIRKSPTNDADSIANYMRTKLQYQGYGGTYSFNESGDVEGGEWIIEPIVK